MVEGRFRRDLFSQFARIGKALASPGRVEMIYLLSQGPKSVEQLAEGARLSVANASRHLQILRSARLVDSEKQGQRVIYRLASPAVEAMWQCLQGLGEDRLLEIKELVRMYIERRDEMRPMTRDALLERINLEEVVVIDVRPEDEFAAGHLPWAISVPLARLESRLAELPRDREIVAYCRGPYCLLAVEAVERLRARGYRAVRLADGFPEWKARGLSVETVVAPQA
jgi:rhodanese-related sulfurtransferase